MEIYNTGDFGKAVRAARKQKGYTQAYISEVTGLSISFISDLERGKATTELGKAIILANTLGLDLVLNERG